MAKIIVYHSQYGCDTGCCGHSIEVTEGELKMKDGRFRGFTFSHPDSNEPEELLRFAKEFVTEEYGEEHVKDLDWENCKVLDCY